MIIDYKIIVILIVSFPAYAMMSITELEAFHTKVRLRDRSSVSETLEAYPKILADKDARGDSALHIAVQCSANNMMNVMLDHIEKYKRCWAIHPLSMQNKSGSTPIISAVIWGNYGALAALLAKASSEQVDCVDIYKRTGLHYAAWIGNTSMALMLLKAGAYFNIADKDKKTPYDLAVDRHGKKSRITELFLKADELSLASASERRASENGKE
jgi:ankyrin repeat protein